MASELGQTAAQLRLKNYDLAQSRGKPRKLRTSQPITTKFSKRRDEGKSQKNNRQTGQDFGPARAANVKIAIINPDTEQNDLDDAAPALNQSWTSSCVMAEPPPPREAQATFSFTSWTRKISAPRARRIPVSAIVGAARVLISEEFISFPRNDLRETPTTSGGDRARVVARDS